MKLVFIGVAVFNEVIFEVFYEESFYKTALGTDFQHF